MKTPLTFVLGTALIIGLAAAPTRANNFASEIPGAVWPGGPLVSTVGGPIFDRVWRLSPPRWRAALFDAPSIDAEPRIIGIPSPDGGLIGLIPGQDKLLLGGSFPRADLRAPNYALETGFFRCSTAGLAAIGIPADCDVSNGGAYDISLYDQSYRFRRLYSQALGAFWRFGVKSSSDYGGTWRLSSTLGPTTTLGNVSPLNLIEPHFNDNNPADYYSEPLRVNDFLRYGFFQPGRVVSSERFGQLFTVFICKDPGIASHAPDHDDCRRWAQIYSGGDLVDSMSGRVIPPEAEGSYFRIRRIATNSTGSLTTWSASSELILGEEQAASQVITPLPFPKLWPSVRQEFIRAGESTYGSVGLWAEYGSNVAPTSLRANWYRCRDAHDAGFELPADCKLIEGRNIRLEDTSRSEYYYSPSEVDVGFRLMLGVAATNSAGTTNTFSATSVVVLKQRNEPPAFSADRGEKNLGFLGGRNKALLELQNFRITGFPQPSLDVLFRICESPPTVKRRVDDCQVAGQAHLRPLQLDQPLAVSLSSKLKGGYLSAIMTLTNSEGTAELGIDYPQRVSLLRVPKWVGVPPALSGWTSPGSTLRITPSPDLLGSFDTSDGTIGWLICTAGGDKQLAGIPQGCLQLPANRESLVVRKKWDGKYVRAFVKGTNGYGTSYVVTPAVGPISAAPYASIPTIAGTAKIGLTLAAKAQNSQGGLVTLFAWYRCVSEGPLLTMTQPTDCVNIPNESGASYTIKPRDIGYRIRVRTYLYNQSGYAFAYSRTTEKVE